MISRASFGVFVEGIVGSAISVEEVDGSMISEVSAGVCGRSYDTVFGSCSKMTSSGRVTSFSEGQMYSKCTELGHDAKLRLLCVGGLTPSQVQFSFTLSPPNCKLTSSRPSNSQGILLKVATLPQVRSVCTVVVGGEGGGLAGEGW